jgi:hypothetical protein
MNTLNNAVNADHIYASTLKKIKGNRTDMKYSIALIAAGFPNRRTKVPQRTIFRRCATPYPQARKAAGMQSASAPRSRFARTFVLATTLFICLGSVRIRAQQNEQEEMRGLDEQVQELKSDVLSIAAELDQLEEKLLYPSGTQVAVFVALAREDALRLDAVRIQVDGQLVAHYIYSFKELEALRKGGVQRIYVGNVSTGDHQLDIHVNGKLNDGGDFSRSAAFNFRKEVKPKLVELTVAGPESGDTPITFREW